MTQRQLLKELKQAVKRAGSQASFAREHGLLSPMLSLTLNGKRKVNDTMAAALGYDVKKVYVKSR